MLFYWLFFSCLSACFRIELLWYWGSSHHPIGNLPSFLCPCLDLVNGIIFCFPAALSPALSGDWYSIWEVLYLVMCTDSKMFSLLLLIEGATSEAFSLPHLLLEVDVCSICLKHTLCGWMPFTWSPQTSADHIQLCLLTWECSYVTASCILHDALCIWASLGGR